jgi:hypothetical protein
MSKVVKIFAALFLVAGAMALTPSTASAQHHWHHHGGGWGWGPSFGFGIGVANPYYYGGGPYYAYNQGPNCGWARVRVWRGDHWGFRRAWRCW